MKLIREIWILYIFTSMWNLKNKQMNTTKEKQTHTYREQISGYHWGEKRERGKTGKED